MRIHVTAATLVLLASLFFRVSRVEFLAVLLTISFVIGTELVNTAVEATIDVATDGFDPVGKIAKDVAAGAVLVSAGLLGGRGVCDLLRKTDGRHSCAA